jgi:arsenate reductase-like glutaredoxin family protein
MDRITGKVMKIDRTIPDDDDSNSDTATGTANETQATPALTITTETLPDTPSLNVETAKLPNELSVSRNVKISNLRFETTQSELESLCKRFGDIEKTTLIKDKTDETKNRGVAYVLFVSSTAAARCLVELKSVQNRPVTVTEARRQQGENNNNNSSSSKRKASRYWQTTDDLSVKCFHCGLYGHLANACQNAKQLKPCTLCGLTSHDARTCDRKVFCYQCGMPGHASRNCPEKPMRRLICTICYGGDHHRSQCSNYRGGEPYDVRDAVCIICGKLGHFSCQSVTVFYGLRGISCCNWYILSCLEVPLCSLLMLSLI